MDIPFITDMPSAKQIDSDYRLVVDAVFGFSFKGNPKPPFGDVLSVLKDVKIPVCSVDIPSGELNVGIGDEQIFSFPVCQFWSLDIESG